MKKKIESSFKWVRLGFEYGLQLGEGESCEQDHSVGPMYLNMSLQCDFMFSFIRHSMATCLLGSHYRFP